MPISSFGIIIIVFRASYGINTVTIGRATNSAALAIFCILSSRAQKTGGRFAAG
jgi:hypothetical protein